MESSKGNERFEQMKELMKKSGLLSSTKALHFIHFNDVYNVHQTATQVGAARFISAVKRYPNHHVLFSGDAFAPSVLSSMMQGRNMVRVLNEIGIEVACIGNHDLDYGIQELVSLSKATKFPWMMSNMADKKTGRLLADAKEYHIVVDQNTGLRIGYFSVGQQEWIHTLATCVDKSRIRYSHQIQVGKRIATYLRKEKKCDVVIALTHMRIPNDDEFSLALHDLLDLALGGHDHCDYYNSNKGLLFAKSGTDFRMFSKIDLLFFPDKISRQRFGSALEYLSENMPHTCPSPGELVCSANGREMYVVPSKYHPYVVRIQQIMVQEIPGLMPDPTIDSYIKGLVYELEKIEGVQIGVTGVVLDSRFSAIRTQPTNLTCFFADLIQRETQTDFVIINCGTLRADALMAAGEFCRRDINQLLPMHDPLVKLRLTGAQLIRALENGVSSYPKLEGRWPMVSGIRFAYDPKRPPHSRILNSGEPLKYDKIYTVTTKGFIASGGDGYLVFPECERYDSDYDIVLSSLMASYFEKLKVRSKAEVAKKYKEVQVGPSLPERSVEQLYDPVFGCIKLSPINDERIKRIG